MNSSWYYWLQCFCKDQLVKSLCYVYISYIPTENLIINRKNVGQNWQLFLHFPMHCFHAIYIDSSWVPTRHNRRANSQTIFKRSDWWPFASIFYRRKVKNLRRLYPGDRRWWNIDKHNKKNHEHKRFILLLSLKCDQTTKIVLPPEHFSNLQCIDNSWKIHRIRNNRRFRHCGGKLKQRRCSLHCQKYPLCFLGI